MYVVVNIINLNAATKNLARTILIRKKKKEKKELQQLNAAQAKNVETEMTKFFLHSITQLAGLISFIG